MNTSFRLPSIGDTGPKRRPPIWQMTWMATVPLLCLGCVSQVSQHIGYLDPVPHIDPAVSVSPQASFKNVTIAVLPLEEKRPVEFPEETTINNASYARNRLFADEQTLRAPPSPTGYASSGKVGNYLWAFGPTAITLKSISIDILSSNLVWYVLALCVLTSISAMIILWRQGT